MTAKLEAPKDISAGQFAQNLAESGLFDAADLLPESGPVADGAAAAKRLVEAGKLTGYQAEAVRDRRFADLRIGNYEILERLGAGGMGTVFKARHRRMKRVVAIKVLSREVAKSGPFADRFQREVETIARLSHPNIVMAYDADEAEVGPFLVMEFVNGRDLASEVEKNGPLSPGDAVDRILQAARGLEYAHTQGIVHRDVKPGNILRDVDGVVKVADLGLARLSDAGGKTSLTQAGAVFGTVDYMSPEQAVDSGQVDQRADIYSLGCTLFFLLAGRPPYPASSLMAAMLKHRDDPIPNLRKHRPDLPVELETVFRRMMAKNPDDRYPSMTVLAEDLERIRSKIGTPSDSTGLWLPPADRPPRSNPSTEIHPASIRRASDAGHFDLGRQVPTTAPSQTGRASHSTIILVEPSRTQAGIIRRFLQQLGMDSIHSTGAGSDALTWARRERVGVIISSMHLADMTGAQLAETVLADATCQRIGFVLATSEADTKENHSIPQSSRLVLLSKPFDSDRLAAAIAAVIQT
jgi:serine/threonine-protein kinase